MQESEKFIEEIKNKLGAITTLTIKNDEEKIGKISSDLLIMVNDFFNPEGRESFYHIQPEKAKALKNNIETIESYDENLVEIAVAICLKVILHAKPDGSSEIGLSFEKHSRNIRKEKQCSSEDNKINRIISEIMRNIYLQNNLANETKE